MNIQTKHNVGDEIWVIEEGMLEKKIITNIKTSTSSKYNDSVAEYLKYTETKVVYGYYWGMNGPKYVDDSACLPTVDEFVNYSLDKNSPKL